MPSSSAAAVVVSVVIPAFNSARYLRETVHSALSQTLADLEIIVVDDGSTDNTLEVAKSIRDPRLRILSGANSGPAAARNRGWRATRPSSFVGFLDADDLWDATKLAEQVDFLTRRPDLTAAGCFMRYISSSGRVLGRTGQTVDAAELQRIARGELFPFPTPSLLVRRSALAVTGGFDECFRHAGSEDLEFLSRLARVGPMDCVPRVLGSYRIHSASAMARNRIRINREARFVRARIAARQAGGDLTWETFARTHRPTWGERHQDFVEVAYRSAALWHGEGESLRALAYGGLALLAGPRYTIRRLYRQRFRHDEAGGGSE